MNIKSIDDIRQFVKANPSHSISAAWADMLFDMDNYGDEYDLGDFMDEVSYMIMDGDLSSSDFLMGDESQTLD